MRFLALTTPMARTRSEYAAGKGVSVTVFTASVICSAGHQLEAAHQPVEVALVGQQVELDHRLARQSREASLTWPVSE